MNQITVERDVFVEMRDGVSLATDIYRPAAEDEYPTLVHRNPYNKSSGRSVGGLIVNPLDAAQQGYVVVVQDVRGRFKSEGEWEPFRNEAADGYDTVEWAATQPWSNQNVGIYGSSYHGVTTLQTIVQNPPHLEAGLAYLTGTNFHDGWTYTGGAFELGFNFWWVTYLVMDTIERLDLSSAKREQIEQELYSLTSDSKSVLRNLPVRDISLFRSAAAEYCQDWFDHPSYDSYWKTIDIKDQVNRIEVPILHVTGWYDIFLRGLLDLFGAIESDGHDRVQEHHRLLIGPWDHEAYTTLTSYKSGDRAFGLNAVGGQALLSDLTINWFDRWLKEDGSSGDMMPRVRYFMMGDNEWRDAEVWPPDYTEVSYYLHSGGNANTRNGDGVLSRNGQGTEPVDSYEYDPEDPVPSCGGRSLMPNIGSSGVQDQSQIEERNDVLVYTSSRLALPLKVAGPVRLHLYATSSAPDTDFTAKLVDVEPDGYCANIAEGIIRARYRDSPSDPVFLEPGRVYAFTVDLQAVAHTFQRGHRLRIEISSSNFPRFDRNLNTTTPPADATANELTTATQQVYHDEERPSQIVLPVLN